MKKLKYYQEQDSIFYKLNLIKDVEKCQDVYADLHFFEIYLMHNIHQEYSKHYGEDWKNDNQFWKNGNSFEYKQFIDNGKITLGFWVYLFRNNPHKYFKESSNNKGNIPLKNIFPGLTPKKLTHKIIHSDLQKIKNFRNVIFHFDIESFILDKNNQPTKIRYIDEFQYYQELVQEYTEALACDDVFLNRNEIDIYSHTVFNYIKKIQNVKIVDCNILDFIDYYGNNNDIINILFEYNGLEIIIIYYNISAFGELGIKYCITNDIYNFFDVNSDKTKIMKIKNKPLCDFIRIGIFDIFDDSDFYQEIVSSYVSKHTDNKTKFITTLYELPNLLNKIQNDNAN